MSRASNAYAALVTAMEASEPACRGDDRFTADDSQAAALAPICDSCPFFDLCSAYGNLERPKAGVWAGRRYRTNQPRQRGASA